VTDSFLLQYLIAEKKERDSYFFGEKGEKRGREQISRHQHNLLCIKEGGGNHLTELPNPPQGEGSRVRKYFSFPPLSRLIHVCGRRKKGNFDGKKKSFSGKEKAATERKGKFSFS